MALLWEAPGQDPSPDAGRPRVGTAPTREGAEVKEHHMAARGLGLTLPNQGDRASGATALYLHFHSRMCSLSCRGLWQGGLVLSLPSPGPEEGAVMGLSWVLF